MTPDSNNVDGTAAEISAERNSTENEIEAETINDAYKKVATQNGTDVNGIPTTETNNTTTLENATTTKTATTKKGNNSNKDPMTEDGFTVITTHEYYNSDLDSTTTSQNKQKIDSLVAANKRVMAIKDSIARKRATDSIKLNKARKDSIPE